MGHDAPGASDAGDLTPEQVANAEFPTSFRGYDTVRVRAFLARVAGELRAHGVREDVLRERIAAFDEHAAEPAFDEDRVVAELGGEATRILSEAREGARSIAARAEEEAEVLRREAAEQAESVLAAANEEIEELRARAAAEAAELRAEAEQLLERRTAEAEAATADLTAEAERLREEARTARDAELAAARAEGRLLVAEAREVRARVLRDMAQRRNMIRRQVERLRAGRDRLLGAVDHVRRNVDEITVELSATLGEAKVAADRAARKVDVDTIPSDEDLEDEVDLARRSGLRVELEPEPERWAASAGLGEPLDVAAGDGGVDGGPDGPASDAVDGLDEGPADLLDAAQVDDAEPTGRDGGVVGDGEADPTVPDADAGTEVEVDDAADDHVDVVDGIDGEEADPAVFDAADAALLDEGVRILGRFDPTEPDPTEPPVDLTADGPGDGRRGEVPVDDATLADEPTAELPRTGAGPGDDDEVPVHDPVTGAEQDPSGEDLGAPVDEAVVHAASGEAAAADGLAVDEAADDEVALDESALDEGAVDDGVEGIRPGDDRGEGEQPAGGPGAVTAAGADGDVGDRPDVEASGPRDEPAAASPGDDIGDEPDPRIDARDLDPADPGPATDGAEFVDVQAVPVVDAEDAASTNGSSTHDEAWDHAHDAGDQDTADQGTFDPDTGDVPAVPPVDDGDAGEGDDGRDGVDEVASSGVVADVDLSGTAADEIDADAGDGRAPEEADGQHAGLEPPTDPRIDEDGPVGLPAGGEVEGAPPTEEHLGAEADPSDDVHAHDDGDGHEDEGGESVDVAGIDGSSDETGRGEDDDAAGEAVGPDGPDAGPRGADGSSATEPSRVSELFARLRAAHREAEQQTVDVPAETSIDTDGAGANGHHVAAPSATGSPAPVEDDGDADVDGGSGGVAATGGRAEPPAARDEGPDPVGGREPARPQEGDGASPSDRVLLSRRDALVAGVSRDLSRRLKRALADDQNELLEMLRHQPPGEAEVGGAERRDRVAAAIVEDLVGAAELGQTFDGTSASATPADVTSRAADLALAMLGPLDAAVAEALSAAGEDERELSERIRSAYREARSGRVESLAEHHVLAAFSQGRLAAFGAGTPIRWVADRCSPDCEDNVLAGPVPAGEPFPTGHRFPPAHAGCRCLVMAVDN